MLAIELVDSLIRTSRTGSTSKPIAVLERCYAVDLRVVNTVQSQRIILHGQRYHTAHTASKTNASPRLP